MRLNLLLVFGLLIGVSTVWAQGVTTSSLIGAIKDSNDGGIPGANITAIHEPSGTRFGSVSLPDGKYTIPNMRVGGPYKVEISFVGFQTQTFGEIYLKLAEPFTLNVTLKEETTQLAEIVVLGTEDRLMNSNLTGSVTNVSSRQLLNMPSISRSINDMTRMTPQATSTNTGAIGGGNFRQNYITVDGSDFNNTFGIGSNLPANGSPISLDALEEISVNVTPYDIRQSGFIGSSINAVTRSGTNSFTGSAYTFWRNENQQGNKIGDNDPLVRQNLQVNTYGIRLGGPILKNKLFFFVNFESGKTISPGQTNVAATTNDPYGSAPNIARPTETELDTYSTYLKTQYDYETGSYQGYDNVADNTRIVGRLDWNINQNHRFNIRYSQVESKTPAFMDGSRSPLTQYGTGVGRTNINALWFKNSNYFQEANFYSWAAELNSTFFGKVANTFRATVTHQNDPRSSQSSVFPFVDILDGTVPATTSGTVGVPLTSFGYEPFTSGNLRDVKTYSIVNNTSWTMGKHNITAGLQFDLSSTKNGFQRFATSYYTFASWNDFTSGAAPKDFAITYSLLPDFKQAFPRFKTAQYSIYGQDEYVVNDRLRITAGLRLDLPSYLDVEEIKTHPLVEVLTFADGRTVDTGLLPKNRVMYSPRIGFNWDAKGDRSLQVRGGTGVFTGRVPTVWITSQSGDAGLIQFTQTYVGQTATIAGGITSFNPDPNFYRPATVPASGTAIPATVSATDPNFKFPQTWKTSVAVDIKLPWGMVGTLEGIYNKDLYIAKGQNANLVDPVALNIVDANGDPAYPDSRPFYPVFNTNKFLNPLIGGQAVVPGTTTNGNPVTSGPPSNDASAFNVAILSNASKGYYGSVTAKLEKQFDNGFAAMAAYTKSKAKVLFDGNGSQLLNTWSLNQIVGNANNPELSYANYVVPDRVIASVSYRKEYLKWFASSVSLFWEGSIMGRFSYTYSSDFNRDGQTNDLIYVPKNATEITFADQTYGGVLYTAAQQSAMFFKYIEQDKYLNSRRGKYAERNGATMPWRNQIDLRFAQDIFVMVGGKKNTIQFTVDIFNFGNLLNKSWGIFKTVNASGILQPRNTASLVPGGTVKPTFSLANDRNVPATSTFRDNNSITSTYYMQFGLRYIFN